MKRNGKNQKIEYHLNQCEDMLERCYCMRPKIPEERLGIMEKDGFFSKAVYHANEAEKLISEIYENDTKREYETSMKKLTCSTMKFGSENMMILAGDSAKRGDTEKTMQYANKALSIQEIAKRYGKVSEIGMKEIENLKMVSMGIPDVNHDPLQKDIEDILSTILPAEMASCISESIARQLEDSGGMPFIGFLKISFEVEDEKKK